MWGDIELLELKDGNGNLPNVPKQQVVLARTRLVVLVFLSFVVLLDAASHYGVIRVSPMALLVSRWALAATLFAWGCTRRSLTSWILVAMFIGGELGHDWPRAATSLHVLFQIFLRLIQVIIAPLLFASLVSGIARHSDLKKVVRMALKAIVYFELITTLALLIGLAAINISKAGVGVRLPRVAAPGQQLLSVKSTGNPLLEVFPENVAKAVAENQVLQIVVFSILFGVALAMLSEQRRRPLLALTESLSDTMFNFTNIVMKFAPLGVGAAIAYTVASTGLGVLVNLAQLVATLYAAVIVFVLLVLLPVLLLARIPVRPFIRAVTEPASIAFATSSSEAALPCAMESMEAFGVPRNVVAFVIPTGYSFNLDGSTLYLSLATIFVAQAARAHLSFGQQLVIMLTLMLTSKGVAGVSRASLVVLLATVSSFGLPSEPVIILFGVDQLMDMVRTSVNVIGNCLASCVVARWEGEFGKEKKVCVC
jgi:proton glutamate symport protein